MSYLLSLDQGTTGTTAALISAQNFQWIDQVGTEFPQHYSHSGWVEHDLEEIWKSLETSITALLERTRIHPEDIQGIGITNQRETTCFFNKQAKPLTKAIVWQDRRTFEFCHKNKDQEPWIRDKTGLPLDPYFSATKMQWLLKQNSHLKDFKLGTIDTFLLFRLTAGKSFFTDATNASRTLLMDLKTGQWDPKLCSFFNIPLDSLPEIKPSFGHFGTTQGLSFLPDGIPITGILGDQQAALLGQGETQAGGMKCTYGTGAFLLLNTGDQLKRSEQGLLTTIAYQQDDKLFYALEGSSYIAGAAVQWLRDQLNLLETSADIETLAQQVQSKDIQELFFFPYFSGIGSPHWKPEAKGALLGIERSTSKAHIARVVLEGIALSIDQLKEAFEKDAGMPLKKLKVDGGAVANNLLMQMQANFSECSIIRPQIIETTAYGAALAAAVGAHLISLDKISKVWQQESTFKSEQGSYFLGKKRNWNDKFSRLYRV